MEPTGSDLHIDGLLSNMSVGYMNEPSAYIADRVFPVVRSNKQSNKYAIYNKYDWFRDEAKKRSPLTVSAGGEWAMKTPGTFFCDEFAIHKDYADEDVDNADEVFNLDQESTEFTIDKIRISRENRWATAYFKTTVWDKDLTGQTDTPGADEFKCWDESGSTPISDIEDAKAIIKAATGLMPNTLVVAERVHQALKNHTDVVDRYKYTQAGIITAELLARVFEIDRYLVGGAVVAASPEGSESLGYLLNQYDALLVYSSPRPSRRRPSGGYTFRWMRPKWGGSQGDRLEATTRKFWIKEIRGTRVETSAFEDIKLVASACGVFFDDAIAAGRTLT